MPPLDHLHIHQIGAFCSMSHSNSKCRMAPEPAARDTAAIESSMAERLPYAKVASPMEVR